MVKVPAFAKAFAGRWRIVEMDVWDNHVPAALSRRLTRAMLRLEAALAGC
jgi:hypothetical protein